MPPLLSLRLLAPVVATGILGASVILSTLNGVPEGAIMLSPTTITPVAGNTFTVDITVESAVPVNVFHGDISFNPSIVSVTALDYNTSIADLWAERPWYANGDGTITFTGGTTAENGFQGDGVLMTVTFQALAPGNSDIVANELRLLAHDGLGSDVAIRQTLDAVYTIIPEASVVAAAQERQANAIVLDTPAQTDLNGDGEQTIADVSIFMRHLTTQNIRSDFNEDGSVTTADLSVLLQAGR